MINDDNRSFDLIKMDKRGDFPPVPSLAVEAQQPMAAMAHGFGSGVAIFGATL